MREKTNSREVIVETAAGLFNKQGFHGTGLNQIIKESQCPKGSLYYYFPEGKVELALECIRHTKSLVAAKWNRLFAAHEHPAQAIQLFVEETAQEAELTNFECFLPLSFWTAVEASYINEKLREAWQDVFLTWQSIVSEALQRIGIAESQADETAMTVISLLEGSLHLALTARDTRPILNASKHVRLYLDSVLAQQL